MNNTNNLNAYCKTRGLIGLIGIAAYGELTSLVSGTGVHILTADSIYIDGGYHLMALGGTQLGSGHNLVSTLANSLRNICIT